ncbi:MAG: phosphatidylserine decarboxylase [Methylacidiphilales bacterium]|nr:phosphatidylserine decarboxylase [Candidatus Methylacidiphilales bacterium]MDW8350058.1 phosphatidylserine decarboxylase [Verrucomicrobiae bacterium]
MIKLGPGWIDGFIIGAPIAILGGVLAVFLPHIWGWSVGMTLLILSIAVLLFFRDPERNPPGGEENMVAAADGIITNIEEVHLAELGKTKVKRVSIFLSVFDVHVNRYPLSGRIVSQKRVGGLFLDARKTESATRNARMDWIIETIWGRILVRQITGLIARRIVAWGREGDIVARGERLGMIRFGSRTDVFFPLSWPVQVKIGDRVRAGETVIARCV